MRAPKKIYWVEITGGPGLRYAERGGGKFTSLQFAKERVESLNRQGKTAEIYQSQDIEWSLVDEAIS